MTPNLISKGIISALKKIVLTSIFLYFIFLIKNILSYLIISMIVVIILNPLKKFLELKLKFKNTSATITSIIALISVLAIIIKSFIPLLIEQGKNLSLLNSNQLQKSFNKLLDQYSQFMSSSESLLINSKFIEQVDLSYISELLNNIISTLGSFSIGIFIVIFISFFLLKDYTLIIEKFKLLIPSNLVSKVNNSLIDINETKIPSNRKLLEPITNETIQMFDNYEINEIEKFICRFKNKNNHEIDLNNGMKIIQIIGNNFSNKNYSALINHDTSFNLSFLKGNQG